MEGLETKSHTVEVKASAEGIIEAYASTFNGVDSYGDTIRPGAFTKTVAERGPSGSRKIKTLLNHDAWGGLPVGVPQAMTEDAYGLLTSTKMSATQTGRDIYTLAQEGAISELSIGYWPVKFTYADETQTGYRRELLEVGLLEYSFVTIPADERAVITGLKSVDDLERAIRRAAAIADVNLSTKAGRTLSGANAKRVQAALKELQDLLVEAGIEEAAQEDGTSDDPTPAEKSRSEPLTHSPLLTALQQKTRQLDTEGRKGTLLSDLRRFGESLGGTP